MCAFCRMRIDIIGDSHFDNLKNYKFPLDVELVSWTKRGGGVAYLEQTLEDIKQDRARNINTDIIIVFIGGNDLDQPFVPVKKLATRFSLMINKIARVAGGVAILKPWPRPGARQGLNYWTNVELFNHFLPDMLVMNSWMWSWDKSMKFSTSFFARDRVHCRPEQFKKVIRYTTSAILAAIKFLRRRGILPARRQLL